MVSTVDGQPPHDRSIGQLINDASEQLSRLVREEMRMAASELQQKGKRVGAGAGLLGAAGIVGFYGGAALIACLILALALVLAPWLAALIVGAAVLLLAGVLALAGTKQIQRASPPVPEDVITNVKKDVAAVREGLHR